MPNPIFALSDSAGMLDNDVGKGSEISCLIGKAPIKIDSWSNRAQIEITLSRLVRESRIGEKYQAIVNLY